MLSYVQPMAQHRYHLERLLVRTEDGQCWLWHGEEAGGGLQEIDGPTVTWLLAQPDMIALPASAPWVHVDDLPVGESVRRASGREDGDDG